MAKQQPQTTLSTKLFVSAFILVALLLVGSIIALFFSGSANDVNANTAIIRINGPIMADDGSGLFSEAATSSTTVVKLLEQARDDDQITAVILEINSPGGSPVASDEIAEAVKDVRAHGKPVVSWIRDVGASGAYWVASSSNHIVANRMSITGSIGVIGSYVEFAEFLDDWNLTYRRLVSGDRKDIGDPFETLDAERQAFLQEKLDRVHEFFIEEVAANRNLSVTHVRAIGDGGFYLGVEAKEIGLVDELGGKREAIAYLENVTGNTVTTTVFEQEEGFLETILGTISPMREPRVEDVVRSSARTQQEISQPISLR